MNLYALTIKEASELLAKKEITATELTQSVIDRIKAVDSNIGAYITVCESTAMATAEKADKTLSNGTAAALTGIPISIKDVICTEGIKTTCASKILENFVPTYDATVISLLKKQGVVMPGKVNMDEFAMGSTTEHSGLMETKNPWNTDCFAGGSSGGSAASVAADMCLASLGSDTGGSIRQPASHCGIVGLKPTYGRVSRYGLVAFASSLDQIGPLTKTVEDSALVLNTICGHDPQDSTSALTAVPDFTKGISEVKDKGIKGMTIGIPKEYTLEKGMHPDVVKAMDNAKAVMESLGAKCVDVSLPHTQYVVAAYYVIAPSEASSNLARYDGVKYGVRDESANSLIEMYHKTRSKGFGLEVQRRIIIGTYALSSGYYDAYYKKASQVRTLIIEDFKNAFNTCDVLMTPVTPEPAGKFGENTNDPLKMYLSDIFTLSANLAGIPGISVPCGFSEQGLPIGLQFLGKQFDETAILKAGYAFESATDFYQRKPAL